MPFKFLSLFCFFGLFSVNLAYARWPAVDPHAENYYSQSPYAFTGNNPVNFVDPDGRDWIRSQSTNMYEWKDDITADSQLPEGYVYVGANDQSILTDLGIASSYAENQRIYTLSLADESAALNQPSVQSKIGAATTTAISVAEGLIGKTAAGHISVRADVSFGAATADNELGRYFDGITLSATYSQPGGRPGGTFRVTNNGATISDPLSPVQGPYIKSPGSSVLTGEVRIPAPQLAPGTLTDAYIGVGNTSRTALFANPVDLFFRLQKR